MAIATAVQRHGYVFVYDEGGINFLTLPAGKSAPGDGLKRYTRSSVSIQRNGLVRIYDVRGLFTTTSAQIEAKAAQVDYSERIAQTGRQF